MTPGGEVAVAASLVLGLMLLGLASLGEGLARMGDERRARAGLPTVQGMQRVQALSDAEAAFFARLESEGVR